MNTVTRIKNEFTDRFAADCARISFGSTAEDYSEERVAGLIDYLVRNRHINPLFHPIITFRLAYAIVEGSRLLQNKSLLAGLNMYDDGDSWVITTSAWGVMELVNKLLIADTELDGMPYFSDSYNERKSKNHNNHIIIQQAETPHHHQWFTFRFETEMNTKNQLYTHTVGLAKSSQSFRYVDDIKLFTPPDGFRGKAKNVKQGSSDEIVQENYASLPITVNHAGVQATHNIQLSYADIMDICDSWYAANNHICNEQRRYVLPQAQITKYAVTGTREAWDRVLKLRLAKDAQKEVRLIAENVADEIASDTVWR
jgi:thymidylate synthase ThyX